jgi:formylglycine-generating enzyme required for sulfatase activity
MFPLGLWGKNKIITPAPPIAATPTVVIVSRTPTCPPTRTPTPAPEPAFTAGDTRTHPTDGMLIIYVSGATFQMGSSQNDSEAQGNGFLQHLVTLDDLWIDQTEVTNTQCALCAADGECDESPRVGDHKLNGATTLLSTFRGMT